MSKYELAIETLSQKAMDIGGRMYALEVAKKSDETKFMLDLFGPTLEGTDTMEEFRNLTEAIKLLKEAEA